MRGKILMFIDPSHDSWILGGTFKRIYELNTKMYSYPKQISSFRSINLIKTFFYVLLAEVGRKKIIFSSITPLQNYSKIAKTNLTKKVLLFTHFDGEISKNLIELFNKVDLILVYSRNQLIEFVKLGVLSKIQVITGAIEIELFDSLSDSQQIKVAWIGTAASRKNPQLLLRAAVEHPELNFKILGRNWHTSPYWEKLSSLDNVEYCEINKPISSQDLKDCSHLLMLSRVEGGPMTLLEALAAGLIPVCTNTGIVEDVLSETGYLSQIITNLEDFEEVGYALKRSFSYAHRQSAAKIARSYSFQRLEKLISVEISKL